MKTILSTIAALMLLVHATGARADGDGSLKDAVAAPVERSCCEAANWSGVYSAISVGYGIAVTDVDYRYNDSTYTNYASSFSDDAKGVFGAVQLGYDHVIRDNWLVGVFGEYAFGDLDDTHALPIGADTMKLSFDDTWSVGGRIGFVRCCTLFYATAGYTSTDEHMTTLIYDEKNRLDGWFVGAGLEHHLRDGLFIKAEYRFSKYDSSDTYAEFPCTPCTTGYEDIDRDHEVHSFRIGLAYKFGRPEPEVHQPLK